MALAARQQSVVTTGQLNELGLPQPAITRALADGRLRRLHHGVYAIGGAALTRESHWMAAVLACGRGALLSHRSAATLWQLADYPHGPIEVTTPGTGSRAQPGIRIHRTRSLRPDDVSSRCHLPVTSPARTLTDLAALISPRHLEEALEETLRRRIVTPRALADQVERNRGRSGAPLLRDLLGLDAESIARTKSRLEARFLRFCREERLPIPEVNASVGGYEVDASWAGTNVVVELDSWSFHRGREVFERDRAKWADLTAKGYRVIVVTHRRLDRDRAGLAATLRACLA